MSRRKDETLARTRKVCPDCKQMKSVRVSNGKTYAYCDACATARMKAYREKRKARERLKTEDKSEVDCTPKEKVWKESEPISYVEVNEFVGYCKICPYSEMHIPFDRKVKGETDAYWAWIYMTAQCPKCGTTFNVKDIVQNPLGIAAGKDKGVDVRKRLTERSYYAGEYTSNREERK